MKPQSEITRAEVLEYHRGDRPGKLQIKATKPLLTQRHLSLAYSPGVAHAVEVIDEDPLKVYDYTAKGNLVAVVSNGTAILGLGNRGPIPAKPVMEGKALLFKQFADVDVFDIEIKASTADEIVTAVEAISPGFGGINLEDIAAPICFEVEERLQQSLDVPVFHDDQHGTAIISSAALLNALELTNRRIRDIKIVVLGAGAAGIACGKLYEVLGVPREHITMFDSKGMITRDREHLDRFKALFAQPDPAVTLVEALTGADVLVGLSVADMVTPEMIRGMAPDPILFLLANPDPEIRYELALETRPDAIVATGRSDYPNQVNNVLAFPFIFRGALDVRASAINEEMQLAASHALAALTREPVPESVLRAYGLEHLHFSREYIIPKPNDHRVLEFVAPAVAEAAITTGVARIPLDLDEYRERLRSIQQRGRRIVHGVVEKARRQRKTLVLPEGIHPEIVRAAQLIEREGIARPILLGNAEKISSIISDLELDYKPEIIDPAIAPRAREFGAEIHQLRERKGMTAERAEMLARTPNTFGLMMLRNGEADAYLSGLTADYRGVLRPILQLIPLKEGVTTVAGVFLIMSGNRVHFVADGLVNVNPEAQSLAEIAIMTADFARDFDIEPRVAMVSFSNFGSARYPESKKMADAVRIVRERRPDIEIDGEMQADTALSAEVTERRFPFSRVKGANVLIFPNLDAATAAYKVVSQLGEAQVLGPILLGPKCSAHPLMPTADEETIMLVAALAMEEASCRRHTIEDILDEQAELLIPV